MLRSAQNARFDWLKLTNSSSDSEFNSISPPTLTALEAVIPLIHWKPAELQKIFELHLARERGAPGLLRKIVEEVGRRGFGGGGAGGLTDLEVGFEFLDEEAEGTEEGTEEEAITDESASTTEVSERASHNYCTYEYTSHY